MEIYSEEACGIEFQRDCDEKDIYLFSGFIKSFQIAGAKSVLATR